MAYDNNTVAYSVTRCEFLNTLYNMVDFVPHLNILSVWMASGVIVSLGEGGFAAFFHICPVKPTAARVSGDSNQSLALCAQGDVQSVACCGANSVLHVCLSLPGPCGIVRLCLFTTL